MGGPCDGSLARLVAGGTLAAINAKSILYCKSAAQGTVKCSIENTFIRWLPVCRQTQLELLNSQFWIRGEIGMVDERLAERLCRLEPVGAFGEEDTA